MIHFFDIFFIYSFLWYAIGTKVFTFHEGLSDPDELSSATLTNAPDAPLPDQFIICSSHKQQQVDTLNTLTIYVLYEASNFVKPWFSIGFWYSVGDDYYILWANIQFVYWYDLGHVTREVLLHWIHICVEVDTANRTLSASINGGNVTTVNNVEGFKPVPKLHLRLGVVHQSEEREQFQYFGSLTNLEREEFQYFGSVTNLNIFTLRNEDKETHLFLMMGSNCELIDRSHLLSWTDSKWDIVGKGGQEEDKDRDIICSKSKVVNFRIPLLWTKNEAREECRKYGQIANISEPPPADMNNVTDLDMEIIYGENHYQCKYFWTHYTDRYTEGTFINEITKKTMKNIQWKPGKPDGGTGQNCLIIMPLKKWFNDVEQEYDACVSCEVPGSTLFTLRGICKNSYLDSTYFPTVCRGYIGFIGNMISIW